MIRRKKKKMVCDLLLLILLSIEAALRQQQHRESELTRKMQELMSYYTQLEEFFMYESIQKVFFACLGCDPLIYT